MRLSVMEQIPHRVRRCAVEHQLGTPRIYYASRRSSRLSLILGPLALIVSCAILTLYYLYYDRVFSWWPVWQARTILAIGLAWLAVGLWITLTLLLSPRLHVFLCPRGLIYVRYRVAVIPWNRMTRVWKTILLDKHSTIACSYTLQRDDGARFHLKEDLPHVDRLGGFLEREVTRHRLADALAIHKAGQPQDFLEIEVNTRGLLLKREHKLLSWNDLERVEIDKATITIYRKGDNWEWASCSISGIPNIGVLKGIIDFTLQSMRIPHSPHIQAYNAGFAVFFGAISINKMGISISNGETVLPWTEIASVGIGESELLIRRKGHFNQWYTLPIWMINNLATLKELIDYILSTKS